MRVLRCCHRRFTPEFNLLSDTGSVAPSGLIGTDNVGLRSVRAASEELRAFYWDGPFKVLPSNTTSRGHERAVLAP